MEGGNDIDKVGLCHHYFLYVFICLRGLVYATAHKCYTFLIE